MCMIILQAMELRRIEDGRKGPRLSNDMTHMGILSIFYFIAPISQYISTLSREK